ncbi:MAG: hypothetical protein KJ000_19655 [Pirellulaceae bacterium]|nr:hypothetical protein [Pirellulaceae bacterium]
MSRSSLLAGTVLVVFAAGCARDFYLLEITPDGDGFQRQLTAWRLKSSGDEDPSGVGPIEAEQVSRLEQIYGSSKTIEDGKKHFFSGRFSDRMPDDIGGYGRWERYESSLGAVTRYSERFRGSDDLEQQLGDRRARVDRLVDLAIGWLKSQMGEAPESVRIEQFLNENLRHDLKNLAVYAWTHQVVEPYRDGNPQEFLHRVWQYMEERDYLQPNDVPRWTIAIATFEQHPQRFLRAIQRTLARKVGVADDQPIPACLAFLDDAERVRQSLAEFLRQTDEYREGLEKWRTEHADASADETPSEFQLVGEALLVPIVLGDSLSGGVDELEVRLACGREPFQTNGQWDATTGRVTWKHRLDNNPLPAFSSAVWSEPDVQTQRTRFGQTLLTGQKLFEYAVWLNGLDADDAKAWHEFLDSCVPDQQMRERIEAFRFPGETGETASLSDTPRALLLEALDPS